MLKHLILPAIVMAMNVVHSQENSTDCSKRARYTNHNAKSNTLSLAQIAETERYDVHFYDLDLNMTNTSTALSGTVGIYGTANENLDSVLFELFSSFTISDIKLNNVSTPYSRVASAIKVPVNITTGQAFKIEVSYAGTPPTAATNPLGGSGMTNASSPSWGNQVTWSLSEPFSAFEWFPCKQSLKDKADSSAFKITVPSNCMAGSNGLLENVVDLGSTKRYEWKHRHPIDYYLISVAVARYVDYTVYANPAGAPGPVMIQNFIYDNPATLPNFQNDIDETVDFIELFADIFGPYPFDDEKYGHCMAPLSGGMEHQTMTTQGFFERTLTAHELAHQWWGDYVTCGSWADIWVNEGFASYAEYLMLENLYSAAQAANDMNSRHNNIKSQNGGSVWVADSLNENAIFSGRLVYDKGAAIVHTMRYLINDDQVFFQGLRNFLNTYAEGNAIGLDMKAEMEAASGVDLTDFFEQWYFGEGFPTYSAEYNLNGSDLYVRINHSTSKPSVTPTFTNPIDIRITRNAASDTTIRLDIQSNSDLFIIPNMGNFNTIAELDFRNWIINNSGSIVANPSVSIEENGAIASDIVLYPNPTSGMFTIKNENNETFELTVFATKGKVMIHKTISGTETVDLNHFTQGQYLVELKGDSNKITRKIIKN